MAGVFFRKCDIDLRIERIPAGELKVVLHKERYAIDPWIQLVVCVASAVLVGVCGCELDEEAGVLACMQDDTHASGRFPERGVED